jgi:hypothetical protein
MDFNFYLHAQLLRLQGYLEPAKLSSVSVSARAFAVNPMATGAREPALHVVVISIGNENETIGRAAHSSTSA